MKTLMLGLAAISLAACGSGGTSAPAASSATPAVSAATADANTSTSGTRVDLPGDYPFEAFAVAEFDEPWAMTFLPDNRLLVTEKAGRLLVVDQRGNKSDPITGLPEVAYGGQGGLGDVVLHPEFADNGVVYISYAEEGDDDTRGAAVARGVLTLTDSGGSIENLDVIWRQVPKVTGRGHFGHRIAFSPDGFLFISSGERQKFDPAQDMASNMGKIVRLLDDGSVPADNPFASEGGVAAEFWSIGHRNPLGLAFDSEGQLWNSEMGPRHGDELNYVVAGNNYGYPLVSNGDHYDGDQIPDHDTRPDLDPPAAYWVPAISPAGLIIYDGAMFPDWQGNAFLGGLSSQALVRVAIDGESAEEAERYAMAKRIREVEQGPDGAIWLLEDKAGGRLLKLVPKP